MNSGIYKILNVMNGNIYIGSAINFNDRFYHHKYQLQKNIHKNYHLQNAWNKYGERCFCFQPIIICSKDMLLYYEQLIINHVHPKYNIAKSVESPQLGRFHRKESIEKMRIAKIGKTASMETRLKMSDNKSGNKHPMWGKHPSIETRLKMSKSAIGKIISDETRAKISAAMIGNTHGLGYKHSAETRLKMSRPRSEETRHKISVGLMGRYCSNKTRDKLSKSLKKAWMKRKNV